MYQLLAQFLEIIKMNRTRSIEHIDKSIKVADYRLLLKGIWTGVLISLIIHHFISH